MAKVSLRIYDREIESLIDQNQFDEALAHCKHILKTFPKHLETYRLLGKAYLESKRYKEAADIFERVLMAAPDDFVSHVGMSIIRDDENNLNAAIWHMERAFEAQPSNAAVQGELQRLYGRRDGVEPPKVRMTRGALAHMYVQGELYTQAIGEIRSVLAEEPNRLDMQVLLALAYFRHGQKVEASELASSLIKKYAYCLEANRILIDILPGTGQAENTQVFRHRVNELDPYSTFVSGSVFQADSVPDASVNLERLDYSPDQAVELSPDWGSSLGIKLPDKSSQEIPDWIKTAESEPPAAPAVDKESIPDFMRAAGWEPSNGAAEESASTFSNEEPEAEAVPGELPDWLKSMAPTAAAGLSAVEPPAAEPAETPDWLKPVSEEQPPVQPQESSSGQELPDWLASTGDSQPSAAQDNTAAWLKSLEEPAPESPKVESSQPAEQPVISTPGNDPMTSAIGGLGKSQEEQDESFLWLESLAAKQGARSDELLTKPDERLESTPGWVEQAKGVSEGEVQPMPVIEPSSEQGMEQPMDATPDWLKEEEGVEAEMPQPTTETGDSMTSAIGDLGKSQEEQDESFLWLENLAAKQGARSDELLTKPDERLESAPEWVEQARDITSEEQPAVPPPQVEEKNIIQPQAETSGIAEELPTVAAAAGAADAWLRDLESSEETKAAEQPVQPADELPDWLKELEAEEESVAVPQAVTPQPPVPVESPQAEPVEELPEWLKSTERKDQPVAPAEEQMPAPAVQSEAATPDDDLPGWLKTMESPAAEREQVTSAEELPEWLLNDLEAEKLVQPTNAAEWKPAEAQKYVDPATQPLPELKRSLMQNPPATPIPTAPVESKPEPAPVQAVEQAVTPVTPHDLPPHTGMLSSPLDPALHAAQEELKRGNIQLSMQEYSKLIKKAKLLDEVIFDLREALYRYPVDVLIWQTLGDAHMRANRLQDALDAYTKAEELLR